MTTSNYFRLINIFGLFSITIFNIWLLLSTLCTTVGGIVSLYGTDKFEYCRPGIQIGATVLQGLSVVFCLFALATRSWPSARRNAGDKMPSLENKASDSSVDLKAIPIPRRSIIQQLILISVNITSLVMIVLTLVTQGCSFFCIQFHL